MTTMPNVVNSTHSSQMSTPIKNLPLKTSQQQEQDIDDPLIQGVLKEFEDTAIANAHALPHDPHVMEPSQETQYEVEPPMFSGEQHVPPPQVEMNHLDFHNKKSDKKIFDIEIVKRATIITIILVLFQNNNILNLGLTRLPSSVTKHIFGREIFLNSLIIFIIVYMLMYFDFV